MSGAVSWVIKGWSSRCPSQRRSVDLLRRRLLIDESLTDVNGRLIRSATKTHAARSVPLPRFLADELAQRLTSHVGTGP